ncbi:uncharacterized protein LOC144585974 [Pogona vitticeps]
MEKAMSAPSRGDGAGHDLHSGLKKTKRATDKIGQRGPPDTLLTTEICHRSSEVCGVTHFRNKETSISKHWWADCGMEQDDFKNKNKDSAKVPFNQNDCAV